MTGAIVDIPLGDDSTYDLMPRSLIRISGVIRPLTVFVVRRIIGWR
jgi:hypothetical protein